MAQHASEQAFARQVVAYLTAADWTVYQEVEAASGIADIVATRGPLLAVVEVKMQMGLEVLSQASRWREYSHLTWIAIPAEARHHDRRAFARRLCVVLGLGLIADSSVGVTEHVQPQLRRAIDDRLRRTLRPEHQTFAAAGSAHGARWSPFKETCRDIARIVKARPGITMRETLATVKTHYANAASARASLAHWIDRGKVPGVRLVKDGRALKLYPQGM